MKIYTGFGDKGSTSLWGGEVVKKNDPRVNAYGALDELNSAVGLLRSINTTAEIDTVLKIRQNEIFNLSSEIAASAKKQEIELPNKITHKHIQTLESEMDSWAEELPPLKKFILPGGSMAAAQAQVARTVCRRAEREMIGINDTGKLRAVCLIYINRLSDWFFLLARKCNQIEGATDVHWEGLSGK